MQLLAQLDQHLQRQHRTLRRLAPLERFIWVTRILLALGFIPTGLVKVLSQRFTQMSIDTDVGLFFEGMYRTGLLWNFIGALQVLSGVLVLIPRTATLGACLFFPIILSIFLITVGMGFRGTWIVSGLMLLAAVALLFWDYHRVRAAVRAVFGLSTAIEAPPAVAFVAPRWLRAVELFALAGGFVSGVIVLTALRSLLPTEVVPVGLLLGLGFAIVLAAAWVTMIALQLRTSRPQPIT